MSGNIFIKNQIAQNRQLSIIVCLQFEPTSHDFGHLAITYTTSENRVTRWRDGIFSTDCEVAPLELIGVLFQWIMYTYQVINLIIIHHPGCLAIKNLLDLGLRSQVWFSNLFIQIQMKPPYHLDDPEPLSDIDIFD